MIALLIAAAVALAFSLGATPFFIEWLKHNKIGQQIREDGPQGHSTKAGTPTMGGLCVMAAVVLGYTAAHLQKGVVVTRGGLLVLGMMVGAGLLGLADDWLKVRKQQSLGLNARAKMGGLLVLAGVFATLAIQWAHVSTGLSFTRFDSTGIDLGTVGWTIFAMIVIVSAANAVNLTDGLDGLASGSATFVYAAFTIIGFWQFRHFGVYEVPQALDLALIAAAMVGATAGFLWWNAAPAQIFMGDTGSLAIGAGMASLALLMKLELLLVLIGGLFVLETASVIVQVVSFRFFRRRIFRMAPIHHHFELLGWPEFTVIVRFWILAGLFMALSLGVFIADFITVARSG